MTELEAYHYIQQAHRLSCRCCAAYRLIFIAVDLDYADEVLVGKRGNSGKWAVNAVFPDGPIITLLTDEAREHYLTVLERHADCFPKSCKLF